jgi:hypothetical protein
MGLLSGAFKAASTVNSISIMGKLKDWIWEKAEPKVADFIRGIDASTIVSGSEELKDYDTKYTDEQKAEFAERGAELAKTFELFGRFDTGERNIDTAMYDLCGDISKAYKDEPDKLGCYLTTSDPELNDKIYNAAKLVNNKVEELEANGTEITKDVFKQLREENPEIGEALDAVMASIKGRSDNKDGEKVTSSKIFNEEFSKSMQESFAETAKTIPVIGNFLADKGAKVIGELGMPTDKQLEPVENDPSMTQKMPEALENVKSCVSEKTNKNTNTISNRVARMQQEGIYMPDDGTSAKFADTETQVGND